MELAANLKILEEKHKEVTMTETRAATPETKIRFLEVLFENYSKKAWKSETYADFFLKAPSRNQLGGYPAVAVLNRLLDTAEETKSLVLLRAELLTYSRVRGASSSAVSQVSMREIELSFCKSLCNQLRALERGMTNPNLRELFILGKFLAQVGEEK